MPLLPIFDYGEPDVSDSAAVQANPEQPTATQDGQSGAAAAPGTQPEAQHTSPKAPSAPGSNTQAEQGSSSSKEAPAPPWTVPRKQQQEQEAEAARQLTDDELVEVKRRRAALATVLILVERPWVPEQELIKLAAPLSGQELVQAAEERALAGRCGNPTCKKPFQWGTSGPSAVARYKLLHGESSGSSSGTQHAAARRKQPAAKSGESRSLQDDEEEAAEDEGGEDIWGEDGDGYDVGQDNVQYNVDGTRAGMSSLDGGTDAASLLSQCCCSRACQKLVRSYARRLGNPLHRLQPEARAKLLEGAATARTATATSAAAPSSGAAAGDTSVSHKPRKQQQPDVAARGASGAVTMLAEVKERPVVATAAAEVGQQQKLPEPAAHMAVEGYVPRSASNAAATAMSAAVSGRADGVVAAVVAVSTSTPDETSHALSSATALAESLVGALSTGSDAAASQASSSAEAAAPAASSASTAPAPAGLEASGGAAEAMSTLAAAAAAAATSMASSPTLFSSPATTSAVEELKAALRTGNLVRDAAGTQAPTAAEARAAAAASPKSFAAVVAVGLKPRSPHEAMAPMPIAIAPAAPGSPTARAGDAPPFKQAPAAAATTLPVLAAAAPRLPPVSVPGPAPCTAATPLKSILKKGDKLRPPSPRSGYGGATADSLTINRSFQGSSTGGVVPAYSSLSAGSLSSGFSQLSIGGDALPWASDGAATNRSKSGQRVYFSEEVDCLLLPPDLDDMHKRTRAMFAAAHAGVGASVTGSASSFTSLDISSAFKIPLLDTSGYSEESDGLVSADEELGAGMPGRGASSSALPRRSGKGSAWLRQRVSAPPADRDSRPEDSAVTIPWGDEDPLPNPWGDDDEDEVVKEPGLGASGGKVTDATSLTGSRVDARQENGNGAGSGSVAAAPGDAAGTPTAPSSKPRRKLVAGPLVRPRRSVVLLDRPPAGEADTSPSHADVRRAASMTTPGQAQSQQQQTASTGNGTSSSGGGSTNTAHRPAHQQQQKPSGPVLLKADPSPANAMARERGRQARLDQQVNEMLVVQQHAHEMEDEEEESSGGEWDDDLSSDEEVSSSTSVLEQVQQASGSCSAVAQEPLQEGVTSGLHVADNAAVSEMTGSVSTSSREAPSVAAGLDGASLRPVLSLPRDDGAAAAGTSAAQEISATASIPPDAASPAPVIAEDEASAAAYFGAPPAGFHLELSTFNQLWSLLGGWVSYRTVDYLAGDEAAAAWAKSEAEEAAATGGEERQARSMAAERLCEALLLVCASMQATVPNADIVDAGTSVAYTFSLGAVQPVSSVSQQQWRLLALALMRALSRRRLPVLTDSFEDDVGQQRLVGMLDELGHSMHHLFSLEDRLVGNDN